MVEEVVERRGVEVGRSGGEEEGGGEEELVKKSGWSW